MQEKSFLQTFHYAVRGVFPGLAFMIPMTLVLSIEQNVEAWWVAGLFLLGSLGGFFGGAMLDKVERCRYETGGDEYVLLYYVFLSVLAGAVGATLSGAGFSIFVMGNAELVTVVGLAGAWPGLIAGLWLESLREPAFAGKVKRGGMLPPAAWIGIWVALAVIEIYALWEHVQGGL